MQNQKNNSLTEYRVKYHGRCLYHKSVEAWTTSRLRRYCCIVASQAHEAAALGMDRGRRGYQRPSWWSPKPERRERVEIVSHPAFLGDTSPRLALSRFCRSIGTTASRYDANWSYSVLTRLPYLSYCTVRNCSRQDVGFSRLQESLQA
jgi:hypothetical protein